MSCQVFPRGSAGVRSWTARIVDPMPAARSAAEIDTADPIANQRDLLEKMSPDAVTWNYGNSSDFSGPNSEMSVPSQLSVSDKSGKKFKFRQVEGFWRNRSANLVDGTDLSIVHDGA